MIQSEYLSSPIEYLKGVGPQRGELLRKELGIFTFGDLLNFYPYRHIDRTVFHKIRDVDSSMPYLQVKGKLIGFTTRGEKRKKILIGKLQDDTGLLELIWFQGAKWIQKYLQPGSEYVVFGKPAEFKGKINLPHPEIETTAEAASHASVLQPVYSSTERLKSKGLDSKGILKLQRELQKQLPVLEETLPAFIADRLKMISRNEALRHIHFPESETGFAKAAFRLKFEEFFFLQVKLLMNKLVRAERTKGKIFAAVGSLFNEFYFKRMPFQLTEAQKKVVREIRKDCGSGTQMSRLLQGDVGSGKTMVALLCMLLARDNGYQSCLMVPTEILAQQHFNSIKDLINGMQYSVELLTGSTKTSDRKRMLNGLKDGTVDLLIGTHALIEDAVQFKSLGLVVIDEQHRFGVEQRARLWMKEEQPPHVLVMTATPIPRTLAMTLYGDLEVSVIDELPPGRKEIKTYHRTDAHRLAVNGFIKKQVEAGRQVYVVYPLIHESEKLDLKNLQQGYEQICRDFPMPKYQVSIVHGQLKPDAKEFEMQRFVKGETDIMVATSVIEVGVNVPNATVMIVESAERFGLSQLHQLRGRVGRGAQQSYCILMTASSIGHDARKRMKTLCDTNDGFKIAEADLQLRGAGDIEGTQQSGELILKIGNLARDGEVLSLARSQALEMLHDDPHLAKPGNNKVKNQLKKLFSSDIQWGKVS